MDVMQNFWSDIICRFEWTRPLIGYPWLATPDTCPWYLPPIPAPDSRPRYVELIAVPDTCPRILPPIPWVNQKPSSFKAVDRVPPEILHDISLLKLGFWINKTIIKTTTAKQKQNQQQYFSYYWPNRLQEMLSVKENNRIIPAIDKFVNWPVSFTDNKLL